MGWFDEQGFDLGAMTGGNTGITGGRDVGPMRQIPGYTGGMMQPTPGYDSGGGSYAGGGAQGMPDGSLLTPWTQQFRAPNPQSIPNDPSYQFQFGEGQRAVQNEGSAMGTLLTGRTLKGLMRYGQGLASTFDDKYYNRARSEYDLNRNVFESNQDRPFNKLASLAGLGQVSAGQIGGYGSSYGNNASDLMTGIGNAQAAGTVGGANAWGGALGNIANNAQYGKYPPYYPPYYPGTPPYNGR